MVLQCPQRALERLANVLVERETIDRSELERLAQDEEVLEGAAR